MPKHWVLWARHDCSLQALANSRPSLPELAPKLPGHSLLPLCCRRKFSLILVLFQLRIKTPGCREFPVFPRAGRRLEIYALSVGTSLAELLPTLQDTPAPMVLIKQLSISPSSHPCISPVCSVLIPCTTAFHLPKLFPGKSSYLHSPFTHISLCLKLFI